jgi:hypothetical protein
MPDRKAAPMQLVCERDRPGEVGLVITIPFALKPLASRDGSIDCAVSGSLPATKGPSNTVHVDCSSPDREGDLTKTVVVVT